MSPAPSEEVVLFPESLLTAAAHPDPYPYYAALLAYRPFYQEHRLGLWVALGAQRSRRDPGERSRPRAAAGRAGARGHQGRAGGRYLQETWCG